jgi:hypothetical protein
MLLLLTNLAITAASTAASFATATAVVANRRYVSNFISRT